MMIIFSEQDNDDGRQQATTTTTTWTDKLKIELAMVEGNRIVCSQNSNMRHKVSRQNRNGNKCTTVNLNESVHRIYTHALQHFPNV